MSLQFKPSFWLLLAIFAALTFLLLTILEPVPPQPLEQSKESKEVKVTAPLAQSEIIIEKEGSLLITQTFQLVFAAPRHGMRTPLFKSNAEAQIAEQQQRNLTYTALEARCDGLPIQFQITDLSKHVFLALLGQDGENLPAGPHEYYLRYRVHNAIRFDPEADTLVWNLAGDWSVPIQAVSTVIRFPKLVAAGSVVIDAAFSPTSAGNDFTQLATPALVAIERSERNFYASVAITAKRPVEKLERLIIRVAWPKGFVSRHH